MRKCGKGTLLLMSAVMAASLFTGCGKGKSSQAQKNEVYATIKKSDQSASAAQICAWLSYRAKNNRLFQNEGIELSHLQSITRKSKRKYLCIFAQTV